MISASLSSCYAVRGGKKKTEGLQYQKPKSRDSCFVIWENLKDRDAGLGQRLLRQRLLQLDADVRQARSRFQVHRHARYATKRPKAPSSAAPNGDPVVSRVITGPITSQVTINTTAALAAGMYGRAFTLHNVHKRRQIVSTKPPRGINSLSEFWANWWDPTRWTMTIRGSKASKPSAAIQVSAQPWYVAPR